MAFVLVSAVAFGMMPIFAKACLCPGPESENAVGASFQPCCTLHVAAVVFTIQAGSGSRSKINGSTAGTTCCNGRYWLRRSIVFLFHRCEHYLGFGDGLLLYTYPTIVTLLAWIFFRERLTARKVVALSVASVGTLLVLGILSQLLGFGGGQGLGNLDLLGVVWALAAAVIYSAYIIAGARYAARVEPIFSSAIIITSAAVVYLVRGSVAGELTKRFQCAKGAALAAATAPISTVVAISAFFAGLKIVGPSRASIISTIEPAVTVGLAGLVLHEPLTLEQIAGGVLIVSAVLILQATRSTAHKASGTTPAIDEELEEGAAGSGLEGKGGMPGNGYAPSLTGNYPEQRVN